MPFKMGKKNTVMVKKGGKWKVKGHSSDPKAYLRALYANVPDAKK